MTKKAKASHDTSLEELLASYARGDADAFRAFFARTKAIIYTYLRRRLPSEEAADDVFQDTYFRVHRYVSSFDENGNALAWLFQIARRRLNDHLRRIYESREVAVDKMPDVSARAIAEDVAILRDVLIECSETLSEDEVKLLIERLVEGDSYEEIAERRSWTPANARQRVSRVLRRLKIGSG